MDLVYLVVSKPKLTRVYVYMYRLQGRFRYIHIQVTGLTYLWCHGCVGVYRRGVHWHLLSTQTHRAYRPLVNGTSLCGGCWRLVHGALLMMTRRHLVVNGAAIHRSYLVNWARRFGRWRRRLVGGAAGSAVRWTHVDWGECAASRLRGETWGRLCHWSL